MDRITNASYKMALNQKSFKGIFEEDFCDDTRQNAFFPVIHRSQFSEFL